MVDQLKKLTNTDSLISLFLGIAVVLVIGVLIVNYVRGRQSLGMKQPTTQQQQNAAGSVSLPATHTVATGETLWDIAEKTIGSGYNWVDVALANKLTEPDMITVGQKLTIPKVAKREPGQVSSASVVVNMPKDNKYTVQKDDTLWNISQQVYGTGYRWGEIAALNKITNPDLIFSGNVLLLP